MTWTETDTRFKKRPEISLKYQKGTVRCMHCGDEWDGNHSGNLLEAHQAFKEHLPQVHPDIQPRSIERIRQEFEKQRKEEKRQNEKERVKLNSSKIQSVLQPKKTNRSSRGRPQIQQPALTDEMFEEMIRFHRELKSVNRVAGSCYSKWGFSSASRLKEIFLKARRERGINLDIPRNQRRLTEEMIEEATRVYKGGESLRQITRRYHASWGYSSAQILRNALYQVFRERGIKIERRESGRRSRMTPGRVEVAWHLYSVGNYSLREIGEMSSRLWGYSPSSCRNSIMEALKNAGYKLRSTKWEQGPRTIERKVAIEMIKAVS